METIWTPLLQALAITLAGLAVWLAKKPIGIIDAKTTWLDAEGDWAKKGALQARISRFVGLAVTKTAQTYVDAIKESGGKLSAEQKTEAWEATKTNLKEMFADEGVAIGRDIGKIALDSLIETYVRKLSVDRAATLVAAAGNS